MLGNNNITIFVRQATKQAFKTYTMNAFLITTAKGSSDWKENFNDVQTEMNRLEKIGVVSGVKVQKFENSILVKEFIYNYNGEKWEK